MTQTIKVTAEVTMQGIEMSIETKASAGVVRGAISRLLEVYAKAKGKSVIESSAEIVADMLLCEAAKDDAKTEDTKKTEEPEDKYSKLAKAIKLMKVDAKRAGITDVKDFYEYCSKRNKDVTEHLARHFWVH
jgi:hypothetical protein